MSDAPAIGNKPDAAASRVLAEVRLPAGDLKEDLCFFGKTLDFRLDTIFPADAPAVANPPLRTPETRHAFCVKRLRESGSRIIGRTGMHYRDLIPGRPGGSIAASHIRIPGGGPVPNMVDYHTVGFQLIFCYRGRVRPVCEDRGPPFIPDAGDCVIQPPEIRHGVLKVSGNVEVIEIGVPAGHVTTVDHDLEPPTGTYDPDRDFSGRRSCRHKVAGAVWRPGRIAGFEARETGISEATEGVAGVQVARNCESSTGQISPATPRTSSSASSWKEP